MGGEVAGEVGDLSNKLDLLSNMMDVLSNRPTGFGGREKEVRGYLQQQIIYNTVPTAQ